MENIFLRTKSGFNQIRRIKPLKTRRYIQSIDQQHVSTKQGHHQGDHTKEKTNICTAVLELSTARLPVCITTYFDTCEISILNVLHKNKSYVYFLHRLIMLFCLGLQIIKQKGKA